MVEIYLPDEKEIDFLGNQVYEDFDIVVRNKIVITDNRKFNRLMHELKDFNKYVLDGSKSLTFSKSEVETIKKLGTYNGLTYRRVPTGIEVVDEEGKVVRKYNNPKANLTRLLNADNERYGHVRGFAIDADDRLPKEDFVGDLRSLIDGNEEDFKNIIEYLRTRATNEQKRKRVLNVLPEFGTFVTKGLDCIDFEPIDKYRISDFEQRVVVIEGEIDRLTNSTNSRDLEHLKYYRKELDTMREVVRQSKKADENYKILTLARKMNLVTKK